MLRFHDNKSFCDAFLQLIPLQLSGAYNSCIKTISSIMAIVAARLDDLYIRSFPVNIVDDQFNSHELLSDFERELAIVPYFEASISSRRNRVLAKRSERGGLSIAHYVNIVEMLGYSVSAVEELFPLQYGISQCGDMMIDNYWSWRVWMNEYSEKYQFECGNNVCGESIGGWTSIYQVENSIAQLKPPFSTVLFVYKETI